MTVSTSQSTDAPMLYRTDSDSVATITLNRPEQYNPLSWEMLTTIQDTLDSIAQDESIRVVILAAKGRAFCAGHDLKEIRRHDDDEFSRDLFAKCSRMMLTMTRIPQPVIARVQGIATAAGCQLVANCDLAIASTQAQFAVSGINLGLFCSTPGVALSRNVSRKSAFEMLLTGEFINAEQAVEKGLINRTAEPDHLQEDTMKFARSIAEKPREVIALGKRLFYEQLDQGLESAYTIASDRMACNLGFPSAVEGIDAFIGKRKPSWR
ncbi:MAG: enoyl-CoA hydratase [Acidiferrobacterales bacterium]|nr:enoyl-CoA hydratase [Acidiferrobacterales bacterium]